MGFLVQCIETFQGPESVDGSMATLGGEGFKGLHRIRSFVIHDYPLGSLSPEKVVVT